MPWLTSLLGFLGCFPGGADLNCQGMSEFIYEAELHTPCIVTVRVQSLGQGTHFALAVLQAVFLKSGMFSFSKQELFSFRKENT